MFSKRDFTTVLLAVGLSAGANVFLSSHSHASAEDKKLTNADYARDAMDHLKKAHEDVDHLVNSDTDKKAPGYADANEAKKSIDKADHALGRFVDMADKK